MKGCKTYVGRKTYWTTHPPDTIRPDMITQIIRKRFFCATDVCVIGKLIPREFFCVIGIYRKYHMEGP